MKRNLLKTESTKGFLLSFVVLLFSSSFVFAQPSFGYVSQIGNTNDQSVHKQFTVDSKGNSYLLASFTGTIDVDPSDKVYNLTTLDATNQNDFLAKFDIEGKLVWAKVIGGLQDINNYYGFGVGNIEIDKADNIWLSGSFYGPSIDFDDSPAVSTLSSPTSKDYFFLKLKEDGTFDFVKEIPVRIMDMDFDHANNLFIAGSIGGGFDPTSVDFGSGVTLSTGVTGGGSYTSELVVAKFNSTGSIVWAECTKNPSNTQDGRQFFFNEGLLKMDVDTTDNIIVAGSFKGTIDFNINSGGFPITNASDDYDAFVLKLTNNGEFQWAKNIGNTNFVNSLGLGTGSGIRGLATDGEGDVVIYGNFSGRGDIDSGSDEAIINDYRISPTYNINSSRGGCVIKLNKSGKILWGFYSSRVNSDKYDTTKIIAQGVMSAAGDLVIDQCDNIYITGINQNTPSFLNPGGSISLPVDMDPGPDTFNLQVSYQYERFVSKFNSDGGFIWAGNFGASDIEASMNGTDGTRSKIVVDRNYNLFFSGEMGVQDEYTDVSTFSPIDFDPSTSVQPVLYKGYRDYYIAKLSQTPPTPMVLTPSSASICLGDSTQIQASGATTYTWSPLSGTASISGAVFTAKPDSTTTYLVKGKMNGCLLKDSVKVTIITAETASIGNDTSICVGQSIQLTAKGGNSILWNTGATNTNITVSPSLTSNFSYTALSNTCKISDTILITVNPLPTIGLPTLISIPKGTSTILSASGGETYSWTPVNGLSCSDCPSPTATPIVETEYCVTVMDTNKCVATSCEKVKFDLVCGNLFIPTGFSPNGDNINDKLEVKINSECVTDYSFMIFDRWGEKVFETTKVADSWDGKFNGKELDNAVFVYYAKLKLIDSTDYIIRKGNVSIIR